MGTPQKSERYNKSGWRAARFSGQPITPHQQWKAECKQTDIDRKKDQKCWTRVPDISSKIKNKYADSPESRRRNRCKQGRNQSVLDLVRDVAFLADQP